MRRLFVIGVLFWVSGIFALSTAKSDAKKNQKNHALQTYIESVSQTIKDINNQRNSLLKQLADIEKHYGKTAKSLKLLTQKINKKRRRLKEINREIASRKQKLMIHNRELEGQIKATFIMGKKEKLKLLLNQQDPALASRIMMYYHYLNKSRLRKLIAIEYHIETLSKLKQEKKQETNQLKKTARLKEREQKTWIQTKNKRKHLLSKLNKEFNLNAQQLTHLKGNDKHLRDLLSSLEQGELKDRTINTLAEKIDPLNVNVKNSAQPEKKRQQLPAYPKVHLSFDKLKGKLPWPLKGKIVKKFASKRSEGRWDGVLIAANEGTNIHAISNGSIIYANWLRGYGLLAIIDHGEGYMSLYAFNQSLNTKVGDKVTKGSVIASVGKSGGRHQAGLYFGIRYQGKAVNPARWCRKIQNGYVK